MRVGFLIGLGDHKGSPLQGPTKNIIIKYVNKKGLASF